MFRTPIGFHDAYVAAPSQKAALEAWGSDANLFARGAAEEVTEPALTKAALARPGEIVKVLRGTEAEQLKALENATPKGKRPKPSAVDDVKPKPRGRRPSRSAVDRAERALERAEQRHREATEQIKAEEQALAERKRRLDRTYREDRETLESEAERARESYAQAMAEWAR